MHICFGLSICPFSRFLIRSTVLVTFSHLLRPLTSLPRPPTHTHTHTKPAYDPKHTRRFTGSVHPPTHNCHFSLSPVFQPLPLIITQPEAAFTLASIQHFLSPMHGHLLFGRPLSINIIAIIATTAPHQRAHQSRCHPGELSHGIKIMILMCTTTTTTAAHRKDKCFNSGVFVGYQLSPTCDAQL